MPAPFRVLAPIPLLLGLALALAAGPARAAETFAMPPNVAVRVDFWTRVYTEVGTHGGLVHDNQDLGVVYEVVRAPEGSSAATAGLPIEVLVAPRYEPRLDEATNAAIADARLAAFDSLSPGRVTHTTAWGAGHDIHIDRPDLVIASVRRLVEGARTDGS